MRYKNTSFDGRFIGIDRGAVGPINSSDRRDISDAGPCGIVANRIFMEGEGVVKQIVVCPEAVSPVWIRTEHLLKYIFERVKLSPCLY